MDARLVAFEGRRFRVERLELPAAGGGRHCYEVVAHNGAAVVLPLLEDGGVVLVSQRRPAVEAELLELPAGTLEAGEDPMDCARRELAEETGYRAGRLERLMEFYTTPGFCSERMHAFLARGLRPGVAGREPTERMRVVRLGYGAALAGIGQGRIVDGKTIAALLYYDRFVRGAR